MNRKIKVMGLILFTIVFIQTNIAYSQIIKNYGFKIGITSSNISIENIQPIKRGNYTIVPDYTNYEGKLVSPSITAWLNFIDAELINFEVEASYLRKGSSRTMEIEVTTIENPAGTGKKEKFTSTLTLTYIQININPQIKYNFGSITAYGIIGASINYLIGYENIVLEDDKRNDLTFGYNFGLGLDFSNLLKNVFIEVKYNGDFTEFYKSNAEMRNKVLLINFGYRI